MNILTKVYKRFLLAASYTIVPRKKRHIIHSRLPAYDMLVFANEDVGRQIWLFGRYEADETMFFSTHIRPTDTCFDIGGNLGYFSLLMARLAYSGTVHVFEPIPVNEALIKANIAINGFTNINVNQVAVGDRQGAVEFSVSVDSAYSSMHSTGRSEEQQVITVPMITLDDYLSSASLDRVDVMKVDVEGAESLVVNGSSFLGDSRRHPRIVLMELFDGNLRAFDSSVQSIISNMRSYGYSPFVLKAGGRQLASYDACEHSAVYNVVFLSSTNPSAI